MRGESNGGFLAHRFAAIHSKRVAALVAVVAQVAGHDLIVGDKDVYPPRPVGVVAIAVLKVLMYYCAEIACACVDDLCT